MTTGHDDDFIKWPRPIELVKSTKGSLRCVQACMMMAVKTTLGREITMQDAEQMSGHIEGRETWPYQMMLSIADLGLHITSIDRLDPRGFVGDLEDELRRVLGDNEDDIRYILSITDVEVETQRVRAFIGHPRISYEVRAPALEDLRAGLSRGALPLVSLDYGELHQTGEGYEGHMVIVSGANQEFVEVFDPGPPGDAARRVPAATFLAAMNSPSEGVGAITLVRP